MKFFKLVCFFCLFVVFSVETYSQNKEYKVEVIQNDKVVKIKKGKVKLKKKPFKFRITLIKTDQVFVSSSWGKYYFDYPEDENIFECNDKRLLKGCRFVSIKTGNEDKFNVEKDIYVGDGGYQSVWFYNEESSWHRFDKDVKKVDGKFIAEVTVENIYDMDKRDERKFKESEYNYPIENISENIYMVFATSFYEKGMEHPKELQRNKFIIEFK